MKRFCSTHKVIKLTYASVPDFSHFQVATVAAICFNLWTLTFYSSPAVLNVIQFDNYYWQLSSHFWGVYLKLLWGKDKPQCQLTWTTWLKHHFWIFVWTQHVRCPRSSSDLSSQISTLRKLVYQVVLFNFMQWQLFLILLSFLQTSGWYPGHGHVWHL